MSDLSATQRCVKCGLCLPHCPTFALTGNEADSPRGRISLMQLLDEPGAQVSPGVFKHLDECLQCRACEAMCPSGVPFGALMDRARARLEGQRKRSLRQSLARTAGLGLVGSAGGRKAARMLLGSYRALRLDRLIAALPGIPENIKRGQRLLPANRLGPAVGGNARSARRGNVNLFTGCSGDLFDRSTLLSTQHLLNRLGYRVTVTHGQTCCGALHQHNGDPQGALRLAGENIQAFANNSDPIVTFASGCAAQLTDYGTLYTQAGHFAGRVTDILHFLCNQLDTPPRIKPLNEKLAVHIPCTHRNVLQQTSSIMQVVKWIPASEIVVLNPDGGCCGAAGSYMLTQPRFSDRLGSAMADRVINSGAEKLLTTNIGCALQLQACLREKGAALEVLHPVSLLDRLLF